MILRKNHAAVCGDKPTGMGALKDGYDFTKSISILCHDSSSMDRWESGGILDLSAVTLTIRYKSNAAVSNEILELRLDKRGL